MESKFEKMKIKLVMKVYGLDRAAAVARINRHNEEMRKGEDEAACAQHGECLRRHATIARTGRSQDGFMTAKEFFGED